MATDNFSFYLQNRLIQTSQTGGQWYSIPWYRLLGFLSLWPGGRGECKISLSPSYLITKAASALLGKLCPLLPSFKVFQYFLKVL